MDFRYRHLMLNLVSLLPHCKKDNKVESKDSKGATLNELVELKSCSSCLFFEVSLLFQFSCYKIWCYLSSLLHSIPLLCDLRATTLKQGLIVATCI